MASVKSLSQHSWTTCGAREWLGVVQQYLMSGNVAVYGVVHSCMLAVCASVGVGM
jgi:hypothetical protein